MSNLRAAFLGWAAVLALASAAASSARAQSPNGRFKLGLETAVFEYSSTDSDAGSAATTTNDSTDEISFGIAPARTGVDLGYGLGDTVVLGTRLLLVHSSTELPGGQDVDATLFGIVPHLDYVFPNRGAARVFLGPMVGVGLASVGPFDFPPASVDFSRNLFIVGASFGAHVFAERGVSIDPRLAISYAFGEDSSETITPLAPSTTTDSDVRVIAVSVVLGVSAWL